MSKNTPDFNDPINLQVMWNRLIFIADQADNVLGRTAFSPIVRENHDYVTVLLDSRGRALAQCTWSIPVFITSLPVAAQKYFLPKFPAETLREGDVLDIIAASVRLPTEVLGDLESMVAANNVMGRELLKFLDEYDLDEIDGLADAIHSRSEAQ